MTLDFSDYFWGDKNNGFDVLYHNMKYGALATKELADFFRERCNVEENNSKLLNKLAKQAGSSSVNGTFAPLWQVLRMSVEKLASIHLQMVQKVSELVKEVSKYGEELHKKHKLVKDEQGGTSEVVQAIQSTTLTLMKTKEIYMQRGYELDKLRKDNASPKEIEKAELKLKKAQEDYKQLIEKYRITKEDFESKMTAACRQFQEVEEAHLKQMKEFLSTYAEVVENNHDLIAQVHLEFKKQCLDMTVEKLLEKFVLNKYTGLEKPDSIEFEELSLSISPNRGNQPATETTVSAKLGALAANGDQIPAKSTKREGNAGFLRSRRDKRKEKKAKKKKDGSADSTSNKEEKSDLDEKEDSQKSKTPTPEVDEEGYSLRPKTDSWENEKGSFYSSSDSDSDEKERKLHVEIKPLSNGSAPMSASVDELRATVGTLSLSQIAPIAGRRGSTVDDVAMKRSQSVSQQLGGKLSSDLVGLNLFQSPTGSSASTPSGSHPYAPLQSPTLSGVNNSTTTSIPPTTSRYSDLGDLFSEVGDMQPALPPKQSRQSCSSVTMSSIAIPRPPSRRSDSGPRGRMSPNCMARTDSINSLEFRTAGVPLGSSRGPSPLTIGMADTIPLAVAFHEIIHSYFRGTDETRCQVKMSGDMMLSFPAGIVGVLANNPNPAQLTFRIRNANRLENILPNKQLINLTRSQPGKQDTLRDHNQPAGDNCTFEFNMSALTALLRKQSEQNPSASYFNVDILKYQIKAKNGAGSCPFQLVAYWKCETHQTDLKVDYKYNSHAMANPSPLLNLTIAVPVDGGVKNVQSKPAAQWVPDSQRAMWKFTELSQHTENHGFGSLRARFEVSNGPSSQSTIATQFNCEGTTLSGADFDLVGSGYRLSLVKRRFVSGKYICDGDPDVKNRYAAPPTSYC